MPKYKVVYSFDNGIHWHTVSLPTLKSERAATAAMNIVKTSKEFDGAILKVAEVIKKQRAF